MAMRAKRKRKDSLVWIDCEMTGLDPAKHVLLEIATIITDYELNIIARGPEIAIRPTAAKLRAMDEWSKATHRKSGLLDRICEVGIPVVEAERQTLRFVQRYCYAGVSPLCGNSVWQDKRFLSIEMPRLMTYLHYRIIDVSSLKLLVTNWYRDRYQPPPKTESHRALADIEESIEELRYYKSRLAWRARS